MHSELCTDDEAADAGVAALELLADQAVADRVEAGAAVLLGQRGTEQAHRRDLRDQFLREAALVEGVADDGQHALVTKRATESWIRRSSSDRRERTSNRSVGSRGMAASAFGKLPF
jgi:hypothetical protein